MQPRLGVNIDHVATLRRLRDTAYPDIVMAAQECIAGGADQITVHLREDRRHITDEDVRRLKEHLTVNLNFEMSATSEMLSFALTLKPHSICLVPEKREERTTEGGLDLSQTKKNELIKKFTRDATDLGIIVSFFIEPNVKDVEISKNLGAKAVELHTGGLCLAHQTQKTVPLETEWSRLRTAVKAGKEHGLLIHAGHGIDYKIAPELAHFKDIVEYNIGHAIVCEAVFCGIREATQKMRKALSIG